MNRLQSEVAGLQPQEVRARLSELWRVARADGAWDLVEFVIEKLERVTYARSLAAQTQEEMVQGVLTLRAIAEIKEFFASLEREYTDEKVT